MIIISKDESMYNLIKKYPEIKSIMIELGFSDIALPGILQSVGRIMTLSKGSKIKKIPFKDIQDLFQQKGFEVK